MANQQSFVNGHALMIGVGGDLPVTVNDATALHDILVDPGRGAYPSDQTSLLTAESATRQAILGALDELAGATAADPEAIILIYYSGHGGRFDAPGETDYYLIPYGFDPDRRADTGITDVEFTERIEALQARRLIVLLDCCFAAGLPRVKDKNAPVLKASAMPPALLALLSQGGGSVVFSSSREGEFSYVGAKYSTFTECLIEALGGHGAQSADGFARILDVVGYLYRQVPKRAPGPQHPFVNKIVGLDENFAICYYAGGKKELPPNVTRTASAPPMPTWKLADLEARRATLQRSLTILRRPTQS